MIAAMADASYNKSVFHIERYQESIAAKSHELLNRYDTLLEQETDEETRKKIQEEANEKIAGMLQCAAADTLDKVLYELSGQMKNAYARSDAEMFRGDLLAGIFSADAAVGIVLNVACFLYLEHAAKRS